MAQHPEEGKDDVVDSFRQPRDPYRAYSYITRWLSRPRQRRALYLPVTDSESATDHIHQPDHGCSAVRDAWRWSTSSGTGIKLALTPECERDQRNPIDDYLDLHDTKTRLRERRTKRKWYIIWSSLVTSLLVLVYALDVERSWTATERQWAAVSHPCARSSGYLNLTM